MRTKKKFKGRHKFICSIDGFTYYSEHKAIRWDGAICHIKNIEPRHPQELIRAVKEEIGAGSYTRNGYVEEGYVEDGYVEVTITGDWDYITETNAEREALL